MSEVFTQDLLTLMRLFDAGGWKQLRVEYRGVSILLSHDHNAVVSQPPDGVPRAPVVAPASTQPAAPVAQRSEAGVPDPAWIAVAAPNLGTFYRSPKPGSAPFVELGQRVEAGSELCLLEVMKLFTSVTAGCAGTIRRVSAQDGELVEGGQVLFHIEAE